MEKLFVPYDLAVALKELGFDDECLKHWVHYGDYNYSLVTPKPNSNYDYISAPLWQQAFDWFASYNNFEWPIESWIQPFLSNQPRQFEALYWKRGGTTSIGIYQTREDANYYRLKMLIEVGKLEQERVN